MKTLKNLVNTETLNVNELMFVKGAAETNVLGCDTQKCRTNGCSGTSCNENSCNNCSCKIGSCGNGTCTTGGCSNVVTCNVTYDAEEHANYNEAVN